jgi:hypothetical protein
MERLRLIVYSTIHVLSLLLALLLNEEIDPSAKAQRTYVRCWGSISN